MRARAPLLLLALLCTPLAAEDRLDPAPETVGLIAGVSGRAYGGDRLDEAHLEAMKFLDFLRSSEGGGVERANLELLLAAPDPAPTVSGVVPATKTNVLDAIARLQSRADGSQRVIAYFSGFGVELGDGDVAFVTSRGAAADVARPTTGTEVLERAAADLRVKDVLEQLGKVRAQRVVVIFDLRADATEADGGPGRFSERAHERFLAAVAAQPRLCVLASSDFGSGMREGETRRSFTDVLLDGLRGGADQYPFDRHVTLAEVFAYAATQAKLQRSSAPALLGDAEGFSDVVGYGTKAPASVRVLVPFAQERGDVELQVGLLGTSLFFLDLGPIEAETVLAFRVSINPSEDDGWGVALRLFGGTLKYRVPLETFTDSIFGQDGSTEGFHIEDRAEGDAFFGGFDLDFEARPEWARRDTLQGFISAGPSMAAFFGFNLMKVSTSFEPGICVALGVDTELTKGISLRFEVRTRALVGRLLSKPDDVARISNDVVAARIPGGRTAANNGIYDDDSGDFTIRLVTDLTIGLTLHF